MFLAKAKSTLHTELAHPPEHSSEVESLQKTVPTYTTRKCNSGTGGVPLLDCGSPLHFSLLMHAQRSMQGQHKKKGAEHGGARA